MSGLLVLSGLLATVLCLVGVAKGSVRTLRLSTRGQCAKGAAACALLVLGGALAPEPAPSGSTVAQQEQQPAPVDRADAEPAATQPSPAPAAATSPTAAPPPAAAAQVAAPEPARTGAAPVPLLVMAAGGDGDSWRDTDGVEYRMGLVNAPETQECGGAAATAYRKQALERGFRATVYARDHHGREVAVVHTVDGRNLNVAMARDGMVDDRYLERFRHENPRLAAQLDVAFGEARAAARGIWRTCSRPRAGTAEHAPAPAPQPVADGRCHPDYRTCIPVAGDGSGRGPANDLDCSDVDGAVQLRRIGTDPYRLDGSDQDGIGCE